MTLNILIKILSYLGTFCVGVVISLAFVFFVFEVEALKILLSNPRNIEQINRENVPIASVPFLESFKTQYISGRVVSVDDQGIKIHVTQQGGEGKDILVTVNDTTKFIKMVPKEFESFQQELRNFENTPKSGGNVTQPEPYTEVVVKSSEVRVGNLVVVRAVEDVSKNTTQVVAVSVGLPQ
jgi:hypothetical protein